MQNFSFELFCACKVLYLNYIPVYGLSNHQQFETCWQHLILFKVIPLIVTNFLSVDAAPTLGTSDYDEDDDGYADAAALVVVVVVVAAAATTTTTTTTTTTINTNTITTTTTTNS